MSRVSKPFKHWIHGKPLVAVMLAIGLTLVTAVVALAIGWSLLVQGAFEKVDEAVYRSYNPAQATGSGTFDAFVRISANTEQVHGYNTFYRPVQFDENTSSQFTRAYRLSNIPIVGDQDYPGVYREFQLDINQTSGQNISLDEVEVYLFYSTATQPESCGYPFDGTGGSHSGCPTTPSLDPNTVINVANNVYELDKVGVDPGGNNWIRLNYDLAAGSGKRDMILRVPNANFLADPLGQDPNCVYAGPAPAGSACNTWVILYSRFGGDEPGLINDDGYEEWGVEVYELATKTGVKFNDLNNNGAKDPDEPGMPGWTIYVDINGNGSLDPGEPYAVTGANGAYTIGNIVQGTYRVREVQQMGWTCTYPTTSDAFGCYHEETFMPGTTYPDNDFGNWFPQPSVTLDKTGDTLSKIGDEVTYTITLVNTSTAGTTALECTISDPTIGFSKVVTLLPGETDVSTVPWMIPAGAPDPYPNTATAICTYVGSTTTVASASDNYSINLFQPSITFDKTGDTTVSKVGDVVNYTLTLNNTSSADTPNLVCTITDVMLGVDKQVTLPPGANDVTNASYTVLATDPDPLVNTANVTCSPTGFPNQYTASDSWTVDLFQPDFSIVKTGDALSKIGDEVTYTFTIQNLSSAGSPALNLVSIVDDKLGNLAAAATAAGCDVLALGETCSFQVTHTIPVGAPDPYVNVVTVVYQVDGFPNQLTRTDDHSVNLFQPSITFDKSADTILSKVGDVVNYTLTLNNTSSADAPDLECTITDSVLSFSKNVTLASGASDVTEIPYTVQADDPDPLVNTASVSCSPIGFPNVLTASDNWTVDLFQPAIELDKTGDALSKVGDPINYTITLSNLSSADTPPLSCTVTDPLFPPGFIVPPECSTGSCVINFQYTPVAGDPDPLVNTVSVSCGVTGFPNVVNATASATTNLFQPAIELDKTGDAVSKIGDDVTYIITLDNNSSADTPDLECTITDAQIGFSKNVTLASGASDESSVTWTIPADADDPYLNTASVSCSPIGFPNVYTDSDGHSVNLFQPAIDLTKTADFVYSKAGDDVTYTIEIVNMSSEDSPDLVLASFVDTLVPGVEVPEECEVLTYGEICSFSYTYTVMAGDPDPLVNVATAVYNPQGFPNVVTDFGSWTVDLLHPNFTLMKRCAEDPVMNGDTAVFNIVLANTGDVDLIVVLDEDVIDEYGATIPAGTPIDLPEGATLTYTYEVEAMYPSVSNTINATATLPAWTGLPNELYRTSSDTCDVRYWGFTPGFWKNHGPNAPSGNNAWQYTAYETTDLLGDVFPDACLADSPRGFSQPFADLDLMTALSFKGGGGTTGAKEILLRAGVAALLNASFHEEMGHLVGPSGVWPYTSAEIIDMVSTATCGTRTQMLMLAYTLDGYNNGIEYFDWTWPVPGGGLAGDDAVLPAPPRLQPIKAD